MRSVTLDAVPSTNDCTWHFSCNCNNSIATRIGYAVSNVQCLVNFFHSGILTPAEAYITFELNCRSNAQPCHFVLHSPLTDSP